MNYNNFQQHQTPQTHLPNNAKLVTPPEGCKTLWAGDLHGCDENYVKSMFTHVGEVVSVKLIKDKVTHQPMGYGFIEFATPYMAQVALSLNGTTVGYTGRFYRLNWAKNIPNSNQNQGQGQQDMQMHHNQQMPMKQMKSNYMRPNQNMMNNSMQKTHHMPQMKMNQMGHMNQMNHMQMNQMYQPMVQNSPVLQSPQIVYQPQQMMPQQRMYPQQVNNYQPSVQGNRHHEPVEIGEYSVFVGDLAPEVNDFMIRQAFSRYKSLASARVIIDPMTNISKMYGFVSFNDVNDYQSCLAHMGGTYIGSRPIKVNTAKKERSQLEAQYQQKSSQQNNPNFFQQSPNMNTNIPTQQPQNFNTSNTNTNPKVFSNISLNLNQSKEVQFPEDPNNTVLFIGSLSGETSEEDLFRLFNAYGEIRAVKISHNKDCGFVEYYRRDDAKKAFVLDGTILDGKKIFINWGTNPELKTYNPRFKNVREERTVSHIPVPNIYRQPNFQEPFDVQQSNQHYIQNNYPTVSCIPQEYLSQIVPSKNTYQNYYY